MLILLSLYLKLKSKLEEKLLYSCKLFSHDIRSPFLNKITDHVITSSYVPIEIQCRIVGNLPSWKQLEHPRDQLD